MAPQVGLTPQPASRGARNAGTTAPCPACSAAVPLRVFCSFGTSVLFSSARRALIYGGPTVACSGDWSLVKFSLGCRAGAGAEPPRGSTPASALIQHECKDNIAGTSSQQPWSPTQCGPSEPGSLGSHAEVHRAAVHLATVPHAPVRTLRSKTP